MNLEVLIQLSDACSPSFLTPSWLRERNILFVSSSTVWRTEAWHACCQRGKDPPLGCHDRKCCMRESTAVIGPKNGSWWMASQLQLKGMRLQCLLWCNDFSCIWPSQHKFASVTGWLVPFKYTTCSGHEHMFKLGRQANHEPKTINCHYFWQNWIRTELELLLPSWGWTRTEPVKISDWSYDQIIYLLKGESYGGRK